MSSRLFQEIREKRGLAYAVYSGLAEYADAGLFSVYVATAPDRAQEVLRLVRDEVAAFLTDGITEEELLRGKGHLRGNLVLSLEETTGRMTRLGKSVLTGEEILSPDEVIARIESVTLDGVRTVARDVLGSAPWAVAALGPRGRLELEEFAGALAR
jgi:predicted Zn-dependent peptidase